MGSRMIEEDVMMSSFSAQPRILFITPEVVFMPEGTGDSTDYINNHIGGFGDLLAGLISDLFNLGVDVYVAQPDYRRIFADFSRRSRFKMVKKIPGDRVHLTRDRVFFYSGYFFTLTTPIQIFNGKIPRFLSRFSGKSSIMSSRKFSQICSTVTIG
jgi:hypothetical protein